MFKTATENTAAATVGTTAASGKRVATTTVHFAPLTSSENELALQNLAIPLNTSKNNTSWTTNAWIAWTEYVLQQGVDPEDAPSPLINQMTKEELNRWLPHFVMEARRQDGKPYPPNTLYQFCCGLLRHIRTIQPGWNIFTDVEFIDFQKTLAAQLKNLKSEEVGTKRQAEPISLEDEELLWTTGQLGMHTQQALLDTMFYLIGVSFGLQGGQEHRQLRWNPPQIAVVAVSGERKHLLYVESVSKNNCGGLKMRKVQPKHVIQHKNLEKPGRCIGPNQAFI